MERYKICTNKWIQTSFPVSSLDLLFLSFLSKERNRKVARKGIHKKGYRKNKGKYPVSTNHDLTYTVIFVIL